MRAAFFGLTAALVAIVALPAVAHELTRWSYREQVDQMDDSVWRYVVAPSDEEGDTWRALVEGEKPMRLSLHNDYSLSSEFVAGIIRVRFNKGRPSEHEALRYHHRAIYFEKKKIADIMELAVLLRIEIPAGVVRLHKSTVVTFGLLDFNQAWAKCPDPE